MSVSLPLNLVMVSALESRGTPVMWTALTAHIQAYRTANFIIRVVFADEEGALMALAGLIGAEGIIFNPAGPGQHVPVVERKIRTLKERCRAVWHSLPYRLPKALYKYLVYFCVSRLNMMPSTDRPDGAITSPIELFRGRRINAARELRAGFGDYVQVHVRETDNTMAPRTEAGIALGTTGNAQSTWRFYSLQSGSVFNRDHFTVLPIPDQVIEHLNSIDVVAPANPFGDAPAQPEPEPEPDPGPNLVPVGGGANLVHQDVDEVDDPPPLVADSDDESDADEGEETAPPLVESSENEDEEVPFPPTAVRGDREEQLTRNLHTLRSRREPRRDPDFNYSFTNLSIDRAIEQHGDAAEVAVKDELQQMLDKGVFEPAAVHAKGDRIPSFMFLKAKYKADGSFDKIKARLVAGGHKQDRDLIERSESSSPTASLSSVFMTLAIANMEERFVSKIDVSGAYLNASFDGPLMVLEPRLADFLCQLDTTYRSHVRMDGSILVKLKKALYGCIQSSRLWFERLCEALISYGFVQNSVDKCVFNMVDKDSGKQITVVVYVDDLLITSAAQSAHDQLSIFLKGEFDSITYSGIVDILDYLGMEISFNRSTKCVTVTMSGYTKDILKDFSYLIGTVSTPALPDLFAIDTSSIRLAEAERKILHSTVQKLLYLTKRTRPDILTPVAFLTTRVLEAAAEDRVKLERVIKYLRGTIDLGICFSSTGDLESFIDASFGVHRDGKSHSGCIIMLGNGPVHVSSRRQRIVTKSSCEAEVVALSDEASTVLWSRDFLISQGYTLPAVPIFEDNQAAIAVLERGAGAGSTRHINIRYFWLSDRVKSGELSIRYVPTQDMLADMFTKPLQGELFRKLRRRLLNWHC